MTGVVDDAILAKSAAQGSPYDGLSLRSIERRRADRAQPPRAAAHADADRRRRRAARKQRRRPRPLVRSAKRRRKQTQTSTVDALPEGQNALLGAGRLVIEPSFEYSRSSSNRLVFRGVEIVTGIQIGLIEANDTARDTLVSSLALRYALTDRLEIEGRVPYIYRSDRVTTLSQNNTTVTQTFELQRRRPRRRRSCRRATSSTAAATARRSSWPARA